MLRFKIVGWFAGGWQLPAWHVSPCVQAWPSLQIVPFGLFGHPVEGTQTPVVWHASPVQVTAAPPPQMPPVQVVLLVHALPSSHVDPFALIGHPLAGTQVPPVWHASAAHVTAVPPPQTPFVQVVLFVQTLLSMQLVPFGCWNDMQPIDGRHPTPWSQGPAAGQTSGFGPTHTPPWQTSPCVQ